MWQAHVYLLLFLIQLPLRYLYQHNTCDLLYVFWYCNFTNLGCALSLYTGSIASYRFFVVNNALCQLKWLLDVCYYLLTGHTLAYLIAEPATIRNPWFFATSASQHLFFVPLLFFLGSKVYFFWPDWKWWLRSYLMSSCCILLTFWLVPFTCSGSPVGNVNLVRPSWPMSPYLYMFLYCLGCVPFTLLSYWIVLGPVFWLAIKVRLVRS